MTSQTAQAAPALQAYLIGQLDLRRCLELQKRLVAQASSRDDGQVSLLLCEHPQVITVGRAGTPDQVATESTLLRTGQIEVQWVNRGGACVLHCLGQLAIYPIVPLRWHGFSVGDYLERLHAGVLEALHDLGIEAHTKPHSDGIFGRTGQLASVGIAVRHWVTYHGMYLNVCPPMGLFRLVENDPHLPVRMSCLMAERRTQGKMAAVRSALIPHLSRVFGCDRYHLFTGHPLLRGQKP